MPSLAIFSTFKTAMYGLNLLSRTKKKHFLKIFFRNLKIRHFYHLILRENSIFFKLLKFTTIIHCTKIGLILPKIQKLRFWALKHYEKNKKQKRKIRTI